MIVRICCCKINRLSVCMCVKDNFCIVFDYIGKATTDSFTKKSNSQSSTYVTDLHIDDGYELKSPSMMINFPSYIQNPSGFFGRS